MNEQDRLLVLERDIAHLNKTVYELKTDTNRQFTELRAEMDRRFSEFKDYVDSRFEKLETEIREIKVEMKEMRTEIKELRKDMEKGFREIKDDSKSDMKWMIGMIGGGVLFLAGFMYFLFDRIPVPATTTPAANALAMPEQAVPKK